MESRTANNLQKKKFNKTKLKKTIKNVLCSPNPVFWPAVTEEQKIALETVIITHKIDIAEFKKPLWKDLKLVPKDQRPKPPKIEKIEGLFFGISKCCNMIQLDQCSGVIIEASVNPRSIVQNVLEACLSSRIPVVCIEGLRNLTACNFGIPTSCLGIKKDCLLEISQILSEIGNNKLPEPKLEPKVEIKMTKTESKDPRADSMDVEPVTFQYLYRSNKKTRVFIPPSEQKLPNESNKLIGQDFIKFSAKSQELKKKSAFKKMVVKRVTNNPNRAKVK